MLTPLSRNRAITRVTPRPLIIKNPPNCFAWFEVTVVILLDLCHLRRSLSEDKTNQEVLCIEPKGHFGSSYTIGFICFIIWRRQWHPTPVFLPGKSHGQRSLVGCSLWGRWGLDTTERPHFHFSLSCIGEGNGNPLQCSCLENPRDGGAWWAAVYGVVQSRTRLKRLSSSSFIIGKLRSTGQIDPLQDQAYCAHFFPCCS